MVYAPVKRRPPSLPESRMSNCPLAEEREKVSATENVRLMRIIIYEGPRDWVEKQIEKSITGTKSIVIYPSGDLGKITVRTLEEFPEIVETHTKSKGEPIT